MDDFREIIKILICHFDSTTNDHHTFNRFPYDHGANLLIVASGAHLQVHPLHLAASAFTLLHLMDTLQLFESVSYIRLNLEPATPLIEDEPTISIWDPGINSEFTPVTDSTTKVKISKFTMLAITSWGKQVCGLEQKHVAIAVSEFFGVFLSTQSCYFSAIYMDGVVYCTA